MFRFNWLVITWRVGKGVRLKLYVEGKEGRRIFDIAGQGGGESWKLDNFHRRHMCIVLNVHFDNDAYGAEQNS